MAFVGFAIKGVARSFFVFVAKKLLETNKFVIGVVLYFQEANYSIATSI